VQLRLFEHISQACQVRRKDAASEASQLVIPPRCFFFFGLTERFFYQSSIHQFFQIVVQRTWTKFVLPLRMACYFFHNCVAVKVLRRKGQQNMQSSRG